jgi:hypothetical protein
MTMEEAINYFDFVPNPNTNPGEPDYIRERDGAELWHEDTELVTHDAIDDDLRDRLKKMSLAEFIERTVQTWNDEANICTNYIIGVNGFALKQYEREIQACIPVDLVMDPSDLTEEDPFEPSNALDEDRDHPAWEDLYKSYLEEIGED